MVLVTHQATSGSKLNDNPGKIAGGLAQVIHVNFDQEAVLGQAWLAAPNQLVTCGHVVASFVNDPAGLFLYFPASGNRYPVKQVRLHPSFVRQPDGLVKFDAAVVSANLLPPESDAAPLPFSFEQTLRNGQPLWAIRYPVHLKQLSAALDPLAQDGKFLGFLRKHDNFHLLHDLPLSPGDSGAPIVDGTVVVALHCGDTATLPGLNLPTTSIRLGLWVDALRELGLHATAQIRKPARDVQNALLAAFAGFAIACVATLMIAEAHKPKPLPAPATSQVSAIRVAFNDRLDNYHENEPLNVLIRPTVDSYPYFFLADNQQHVLKLFPKSGAQLVPKDGDLDITPVDAGAPMDAPRSDCDLIALVVDAGDKSAVAEVRALMKHAWPMADSPAMAIKRDDLAAWIEKLQSKHQATVFSHTFKLKGAAKRSATLNDGNKPGRSP